MGSEEAPCHQDGWVFISEKVLHDLTEEYLELAQTGTARDPGTISNALFSDSVHSCAHIWWHGLSGNLLRTDRRIRSTDQRCTLCNKYSKAEAFDDLGVKYSHGGCSPMFKHKEGCTSFACRDMPCVVCLLMLSNGAWILMNCPCCMGLRADDPSSKRMQLDVMGELPFCSKVYVMCFYGCECGCRVAESMES